MSRLDSFIRRMQAQRACLDAAAVAIADLPGPVFELGLGNGRTYDHLRALFADREIFAFDRAVNAHPDCLPDDDHMIVGEVLDELPRIAARFSHTVALVHSDIGTGEVARNARLAAALTPLLADLLCLGGWLICDQAMTSAAWQRVAPPSGIAGDRYFIYRANV